MRQLGWGGVGYLYHAPPCESVWGGTSQSGVWHGQGAATGHLPGSNRFDQGRGTSHCSLSMSWPITISLYNNTMGRSSIRCILCFSEPALIFSYCDYNAYNETGSHISLVFKVQLCLYSASYIIIIWIKCYGPDWQLRCVTAMTSSLFILHAHPSLSLTEWWTLLYCVWLYLLIYKMMYGVTWHCS